MSVMYASIGDLASYLQADTVDNSTATLLIQTASQMFSTRANTMFLPTSVTYQTVGTGYYQLRLPFWPVISVSAVRIVRQSGTQTITDYTRVKQVLFRLGGFGFPGTYPPDMVEVDLTHGYSNVPDDVRGAVLETVANAYRSPDNTVNAESIDDYSVKFSDIGGLMLSQSATKLADLYRGTLAA